MSQLSADLVSACLFVAFSTFFGVWGAGHYYARWQVDAGADAVRLRPQHRRLAVLTILGGPLTLCCVIIDGIETAGWWWLRPGAD
jgi:hypothetical protein